MPTLSVSGGGNHSIVYNGTVIAGSGNDSITLTGSGEVIASGGADTITIFGDGAVHLGGGRDRVYITDSGTVTAGGGADVITINREGTVTAGSGSDDITLLNGGSVLAGNGADTISLCDDFGSKQPGTVLAGSGNDIISVQGPVGDISVGGGNDELNLYVAGSVTEQGASGHDTIEIGSGNTTIYEHGQATVAGNWFSQGTFGDATIFGGELKVLHSQGVTEDLAVSGKITLVGSYAPTEFVGGAGSTSALGGLGNDTFVGGTGADTFVGGKGQDMFAFLSSEAGGATLIKNFVPGDQLYLEGHTLSYLQGQNDIRTSGGNTYITLDGGATHIELKGVTLNSSEITTHKP